MKYVSTTDLQKLTLREQFAYHARVNRSLMEALREQRDGEAALQHIRQVQGRRIMRPNL